MPPRISKLSRKTAALPAFSLIELLVVIAILIVLLAVVAPVLSSSSLNARQASRDIIRTQLQYARAHAITHRTPTALIIPSAASHHNGLRAISLIEVHWQDGQYVAKTNDDGETPQLQRWSVLPQNDHLVSFEMTGTVQPTVVDHERTLSILDRGRQMDCHMMVFSPDGRIVYPDSGGPIHFAIARAVRDGDSLRITEIVANQPVFDLLEINRLTGRSRNISP
jgi:type II secretory pathway pseudopilin PulG